MSIAHKDAFGRDILVEDIVCFSTSSKSVGISYGIVLKLNPKTISTNRGQCNPNDVIVVTEQMRLSGKGRDVDELLAKYAGQFDYTPVASLKPPTIKKQYGILFCQEIATKTTITHIYMVTGNTRSDRNTSRNNLGLDFDGGRKFRIMHCKAKNRYGMATQYEFSPYMYDDYLRLADMKELGLVDFIGRSMPLDDFRNICLKQIHGNLL